MPTILIILFVVGCNADTAATLAGAPPQTRGAPPMTDAMQHTLCCVSDACVQVRIGQHACDPGTEQRECEQAVRSAELGPLWECRS